MNLQGISKHVKRTHLKHRRQGFIPKFDKAGGYTCIECCKDVGMARLNQHRQQCVLSPEVKNVSNNGGNNYSNNNGVRNDVNKQLQGNQDGATNTHHEHAQGQLIGNGATIHTRCLRMNQTQPAFGNN